MTGRAQDGDLATQLHDWATREMHFHPQGAFQGASMPTSDDLRRICRGSHQADLWQYVLDHVRSVQTIKKIKGNLHLKAKSRTHGYTVKYKSDGRYDDEYHSLLAQRTKLQGEITTVLSETKQLENELGRMEADIQASDCEYQREMESQRDQGRKACLLQLNVHAANDFNANMDAFADRIDARADSLIRRNTGVETALHRRQDDAVTESDADVGPPELETSVSRDIRVSCQGIGQFLHQTLQGTFSKDRASFQLNKDQLWKQVETTLSDHSIEQIVTSLVQLSQQGAQRLREHTLKVSIHKDAEKLRFKYEKGGVLKDTATQPSILHSVHQLLEEKQLQHVMRFVETEKQRNAARSLLQKLEKSRSKINSQLSKHFASQPGSVQMANMLIQCQLDLVADRTARDGYRQEAETLREKVAAGQTHRDALLTLHHKIQDFQDLANAKQNLIQVVAKQNAGAKSRLAAQQLEVVEYIARSMPAHHMEVQSLTAGLRGSVTQEVDRFTALSLPYLAYLYLDSETKCALLDLSIHHNNHPTAISVRQHLHSALTHLHFPAYKAGETILSHCLKLKQEKEESEQVTQALDAYCFKVLLASGVNTDIDNITEVCDKVRDNDKEQLARLLPVLHKRISKAARASTECIKIKDCVQSWWEQPGQFITPWVQVEDLSFQQWYNKWRIIVTKIRQLDVGKRL